MNAGLIYILSNEILITKFIKIAFDTAFSNVVIFSVGLIFLGLIMGIFKKENDEEKESIIENISLYFFAAGLIILILSFLLKYFLIPFTAEDLELDLKILILKDGFVRFIFYLVDLIFVILLIKFAIKFITNKFKK